MEKDILRSLEAYFRSLKQPSRIIDNVLVVRYDLEGKTYPVSIEKDDALGLIRFNIMSDITVSRQQTFSLMKKNFFIWGGKLGVDPEGFLFASMEVPLKCIGSLGLSWVKDSLDSLIKIFQEGARALST